MYITAVLSAVLCMLYIYYIFRESQSQSISYSHGMNTTFVTASLQVQYVCSVRGHGLNPSVYLPTTILCSNHACALLDCALPLLPHHTHLHLCWVQPGMDKDCSGKLSLPPQQSLVLRLAPQWFGLAPPHSPTARVSRSRLFLSFEDSEAWRVRVMLSTSSLKFSYLFWHSCFAHKTAYSSFHA
jgi:hypothetical protein